MKLHFDSKQEFQLGAVKAIADIFEGQPLSSSDFEFSISQSAELLTENGFGNKLKMKSSVTDGVFRLKWKPAQGKHMYISAQFTS